MTQTEATVTVEQRPWLEVFKDLAARECASWCAESVGEHTRYCQDARAILARFDTERTATLEREIAALREAGAKALNYITNTESELGITLDCGDALRTTLGGQP